MAVVARAHGVNANLVFHWRKLYQAGLLGDQSATAADRARASGVRLLPVRVAEEAQNQPLVPAAVSTQYGVGHEAAVVPGSMELTLAKAQIRITGRVDAQALRRMMALPANTRIWIAAGVTDLRRGFTRLSALVQTTLEHDPLSGHVFAFRGRRGDLIKLLWFDGDGLCLFAKRLDRGRFIWPKVESGTVSLTGAQLSMLLEGIDWRHPLRTAESLMAI